MTSEKVLYTDGHEVTVTGSMFTVRKAHYRLSGIIGHGLSIIKPGRLIPTIILFLGAIMAVIGALSTLSRPVFRLYLMLFTLSDMLLVLGAGMILTGAILWSARKEKYAIRISTAEGEKNVLVSPRKEYIDQILAALNRAFLDLLTPTRQEDATWQQHKR